MATDCPRPWRLLFGASLVFGSWYLVFAPFVRTAALEKQFPLILSRSTYLGGVTVLEVIQKSADFLSRKGIDSARLQVELLLAHVLRLPRLELYLNFNRELADAELDQLREAVCRRAAREPLQHIVGFTSFCGFELKVSKHALVPRPETELLAEQAWFHLGTILDRSPSALDVGTGSGCIAIALATNCPGAEVHASDISTDALDLARENARLNRVDARIQFHTGDAFNALPRELKFDLIVSNPPYIPTQEIELLQPEVRDHDPRAALDGGSDGMDFYRTFASHADARLREGGRLMLEFGDGQAEQIRGIFVEYNWVVENTRRDYSDRPRILTMRREVDSDGARGGDQ